MKSKIITVVLLLCIFDAVAGISKKNITDYLHSWVDTSYKINQQLFSQKSLKIAAGFLPFYLTARHIDYKVHDHFYDAVTHTNRHQPSRWMNQSIEYSLMEIPAWICHGLGFVHPDKQVRKAMQIFTVGFCWMALYRRITKETTTALKLAMARRPANADFTRDWRYYNGFPSGHAIYILFITTYLGLYQGPWLALPLGLYTGYVMAIRVANNSHFVSQVIGGAAMGVMTAVASYSVYKQQLLSETTEFCFGFDQNNAVSVSVAYHF